jgi:hypothetical protein
VITLQAASRLLVTRDLNVRTGSGSDSLLVIDYDTVPADALESPKKLKAIPNTMLVAQSQPIRAGRDILVDPGGRDDQLTLLNTEASRDGWMPSSVAATTRLPLARTSVCGCPAWSISAVAAT